jgi:hypothetical protein
VRYQEGRGEYDDDDRSQDGVASAGLHASRLPRAARWHASLDSDTFSAMNRFILWMTAKDGGDWDERVQLIIPRVARLFLPIIVAVGLAALIRYLAS